MKKVFATVMVLAALTFGSVAMMAQDAPAQASEATEQVVDAAAPAAEAVEAEAPEAGGVVALHKTLKTKFIEGGAGFMAATLLCLVFGLALCIERIIYLSLSKTNTKAPMVLTFPTIWFFTNIALKNKVSNTNKTKAKICWIKGEKPRSLSIRLKIGVTGSARPIVTFPDAKAGIHKATAIKAITTY